MVLGRTGHFYWMFLGKGVWMEHNAKTRMTSSKSHRRRHLIVLKINSTVKYYFPRADHRRLNLLQVTTKHNEANENLLNILGPILNKKYYG